MPHVTFVHGAGKQVSAHRLADVWRYALAEDGGIFLDPDEVSVVYWADLFDDEVATVEAMFAVVEVVARLEGSWLERIRFIARRLKRDLEREISKGLSHVEDAVMKLFVRQMHAYLLDTNGVQQEIRSRFLARLGEYRPDVVLAHSMGSVIAYDCLKRDPGCPRVEQLLTFGSPLGFPTIQRHLQPGWTRRDGFPSPSVGRWSNVFDPGDPVTIADRGLAEDFLRDGESAIRDREQSNEGLNRHEALDYLKGDELRDALRNALR